MKSTLFLLSGASALNSINLAYNANLNCGQCIMAGFNFCFEGKDAAPMALNSPAVTSTCCENNLCPESTDDTYSCSSSYTNLDYAITMCPQK